MVDKTVSIKSATDKELNALVFRLRQEYEALRLIRELKIKSIPNPNGRYPSYSIPEGFSTETIVMDGKSIKTMTEEELNNFINRLRNENEVTRIITDIQEMNNPTDQYSDINKTYEGISMDSPVEDLYHWGILGMKWGVRRNRGSSGRSSSSNEDISSLSDDHIEARILKSRGYEKLSNEELSVVTKRLQLEKSYRELKRSDQEKGLDFAKTVLAVGGTVSALYGLSQTQLAKDLMKAATKTAKTATKVAAT